MSANLNRSGWWVAGFAVVVVATILYVVVGYFSRLAGGVKVVSGELRSEVAELRTAVAGLSPPIESQSMGKSTCLESEGLSVSIKALRNEVGLLAESLSQVQDELRQMSAWQDELVDRAALAQRGPPDVPSLPMMPPPRGLGANPAKIQQWHEQASPEKREIVEDIMAEQARLAREKIALETDPAQPDPQVLMRVMRESQEETAAKLREVLPRKDVEVLFPTRTLPGRLGADQ